jgi:hypothetical protein
MKRWHAEQALMFRRWRMELAKHEHRALFSLAPASIATSVSCHCANGMGTMRKHRVYGCENRMCFCKDEKRYRRRDRWRLSPADLNAA